MNNSRREFVKKAAYIAPVILSLQAYSAVAKAGSVNQVTTPKPKPKPKPRPRR